MANIVDVERLLRKKKNPVGTLIKRLPKEQRPEHTEGYEGFYHLNHMEGNIETAKLLYIIRDHDMKKFEEKKAFMVTCADFMNARYGADTVECIVKDSYYNMKEPIMKEFHLIENAKEAMKRLDITPEIMPVRGGTDGCRLSYMGIPCPNLFTGGQNFHGRYEYACYDSMKKMVAVIQEICAIYAGK